MNSEEKNGIAQILRAAEKLVFADGSAESA